MPVGEGQVKVDVFVQGIIRFVEAIRKKMGKRTGQKRIWLWHGVDIVQTESRMIREALGKATPMANRPRVVDVLLLCKVRDLFPLSRTDDWESKAR